MNTTITFLGWTDEVTACDLCGKSDLKSTAALALESGEVVYYGCTCAARALAGLTGQKYTAAKIRRETEAAHALQVECGKAFDRGLDFERIEREEREFSAFRAFVIAAARKHALTLEGDARRHADFYAQNEGGAYSFGILTVFGSRRAAQESFNKERK